MAELRRRRDRGGFTLFEILGAVTILAIVYTWLATSAMQGMQSEGISKRRLEASLLADQALMEIETGFAMGVTPEIGSTESEIDDIYSLVVEVIPFDPTPFLGEDFLEAEDGLPPESASTTLLLPPDDPEQAFLRILDLRVVWREGEHEHAVRRTTLYWNQEIMAEAFPAEAEGAGGEAIDAEDLDPDDFLDESGQPDVEEMLKKLMESQR